MKKNSPDSRRRVLLAAAAAPSLMLLGGLGLPAVARAQASGFPAKPVRIVVPFSPGGPTDLMARAIGKIMTASMGQPVIIDNKPGGGGVIGLGEVAHQPADGYTMVFPSILAVTNPALMPSYPFDTERDFSGVTVVGFIPHALVVSPQFPAHDLAGLVSMARRQPDSLAYGSSGNGTSAHLAGAVFAKRAGIRVTHVPYRGAGPAVQDLMSGQIQFMFLDMSSALPQIRAGKLRALAVASAERFAGLPEVPTVAEQGYLGFGIHGWYGLLVRAGTPRPVVERLYTEVKRALDSQEVRRLFQAQGIQPGGMPPAEFDQLIHSDLALWKKAIAELHIQLQ
ncbi:tripartite tricarboxylate transporter substrate binding protein [Variovorax sp. PBL-E5]|uniref:tripartite tricarboxylate transporter substrate binding protein n=1 Tax=Variovorax sp. PBL-E5 TaxID=434014 RepID=UPI001316F0BF|nr:tripartite tricarboxylate transporter substrate binding protein [Variovorax sp. PBL-E5]VTU35971.1 Argininosuccinate lyase [Variovorax sp. PBL-E5]